MKAVFLALLTWLAQVYVFASSIPRAAAQDNATTIDWSTKCTSLAGNSSVPLSCAEFHVPLDYTDPSSNETLALTLVRVAAVRQPVKGSILFNPGGPGGSGLQYVIRGAQQLMTITGGHFNLIGFDPRGVNFTLPFSCYDSDEDRALMSPDMVLANSSDVALGSDWAASEIQSLQCLNATEDIGGLVGTAFVARDMAQIVDALGEDGLLRYWGFSYGTLLGATFVAMFPDKVDKVVLDGNVNVHEYYSGQDLESLVNLDDVYEGIFSGCMAAPDNCALAAGAVSASQLQSNVTDFIENLKFNPIPLYTEDGSTVVTYGQVKSAIFSATYAPRRWPRLAQALSELINGNTTGYLEVLSTMSGSGGDSEALLGIACGEQSLRTDNLTSLDPLLDAIGESSQWGGLDFGSANLLSCARWKEEANEVYSGNFSVTTKNPVLLVGNSYDPVTPLVSAMNTSAGFEGSVVLHHNGYGHCSNAQPSLCTAKAIQAYFNNGTLPAAGTICQPDVPLYSNLTWVDALKSLSLNGTKVSLTKRQEQEDLALLLSLAQLSDEISSYKLRM